MKAPDDYEFTGESRPPRNGEWFLSTLYDGATAAQAGMDYTTDKWILRPIEGRLMPTNPTPEPSDKEVADWLAACEAADDDALPLYAQINARAATQFASRSGWPRTLRALLEARREVERLTNECQEKAAIIKAVGHEKDELRARAGAAESRRDAETCRANRVAARHPLALTWRPEPPDREGWWFYRNTAQLVGVMDLRGVIGEVFPLHWEWAGPIALPLPAEPREGSK